MHLVKLNVKCRVTPSAYQDFYYFCLYVRWLIPLIILSVRRKLQHSDLYPNPPELDSEELLKKFNRSVKVAIKLLSPSASFHTCDP